jgi:hypothetical protein
MSAVLEEKELALARAELHVIEARGRLSETSSRKSIGSKAAEKTRWMDRLV